MGNRSPVGPLVCTGTTSKSASTDWTKSDAASAFDDLRVSSQAAHVGAVEKKKQMSGDKDRDKDGDDDDDDQPGKKPR